MTLRGTMVLLVGTLLTGLLSGCGPCCMRMKAAHGDCGGKAAPAAEMQQRSDVLYTCGCGPECRCGAVSTQPGACGCGKPLAWGHVVRVEGNEALLCTCKEGCRCRIDPQDATRCGCGNPIKRANLVGTGVYFCNCGGACSCNTVSAVPAECRCGMPLKQAR